MYFISTLLKPNYCIHNIFFLLLYLVSIEWRRWSRWTR